MMFLRPHVGAVAEDLNQRYHGHGISFTLPVGFRVKSSKKNQIDSILKIRSFVYYQFFSLSMKNCCSFRPIILKTFLTFDLKHVLMFNIYAYFFARKTARMPNNNIIDIC